MEDRDGRLVEVAVGWDSSDDSGPAEWLSAEPLGGSFFRLESIPFFVYGVNSGDVLRCVHGAGGLVVQEVVRRGGNGTVRVVVVDHAEDDVTGLVAGWVARGLRVESTCAGLLVCVSAPHDEFEDILDELSACERRVVADWEVACGPFDPVGPLPAAV
ncbi:MAG: DUF4265 domain-containing protein [Nitriliruptorales bacterium]